MNAHRATHPRFSRLWYVAGAALLAALSYVGGITGGALSGPDTAPQASQAQHRTLGAPTALTRLHVAPAATSPTYRRAAFGNGWADLNHNGCNTREEVMARDLIDATQENGCNVIAGTLHDPYTGRTIEYREAHSQAVQIDHLFPLSDAWRHGAATWTPDRRKAFANDPDNLLAVDGPTNMSKGDSGPGEWLPVNPAFRCTYVRKFTQVAYKYRLTITRADYDSLAVTLNGCKGKA